MKHTTLFFISLIIISSCTNIPESVGFKNAQPIAGKEWTKIPEILQGKYRLHDTTKILIHLEPGFDLENNDSSEMNIKFSHLLIINNDSIINKITGYFEILKSDLDSSERKNIDKRDVDSVILQYVPNPIYQYQMDTIGLSIKVNVDISSSLFSMGNNSMIKEYRKKYYLNSYDGVYKVWKCYQVNYNKKRLSMEINSISKNDFEVLKRLIELENDTITIENSLNPSKRTFNKFLKMEGFENSIYLDRK